MPVGSRHNQKVLVGATMRKLSRIFVDSSNQDLHHHQDRVRVRGPAQEGEVVPGAGGAGGPREEHPPRPHLRPRLPRLQHGALPRPGRAAVH